MPSVVATARPRHIVNSATTGTMHGTVIYSSGAKSAAYFYAGAVRAPLASPYKPTMIAKLLRLKAEPAAKIFDNPDDLMNWLDNAGL
jgi:hypothetical protein